MNVTREKERMLGEARKAALSYQCLVGRTTRCLLYTSPSPRDRG